MKISIITATYNSAQVINSSMNSVLEQDYEAIEYIIIDGASSDDTLEKINPVAAQHPNIKVFSEPDSGIYDALNKGIKKATGDVIGFVHSDDFLASKQVVKNIVDAFEKTNCDGVYGDLQYVEKNNANRVIRYWKSCRFTPQLLKQGWMPAHPTLFLKRQVYEKHGSFDLSYKIAADYDFILRVFKDATLSFTYVPKVITKMRVGGASNRNIKNIMIKTKEDYRAIKTNQIGSLGTVFIKNVSKLNQFYKKN